MRMYSRTKWVKYGQKLFLKMCQNWVLFMRQHAHCPCYAHVKNNFKCVHVSTEWYRRKRLFGILLYLSCLAKDKCWVLNARIYNSQFSSENYQMTSKRNTLGAILSRNGRHLRKWKAGLGRASLNRGARTRHQLGRRTKTENRRRKVNSAGQRY